MSSIYLPGRYVIVRYGRKGTQLARIEGLGQNGSYRLRKFRANSRAWTGVVRLAPGEVLRAADIDEIGAAPVPEAL